MEKLITLIFTGLRAVIESYVTLYNLPKFLHCYNVLLLANTIRYGLLMILVGMAFTVLAIILDLLFCST